MCKGHHKHKLSDKASNNNKDYRYKVVFDLCFVTPYKQLKHYCKICKVPYVPFEKTPYEKYNMPFIYRYQADKKRLKYKSTVDRKRDRYIKYLNENNDNE